MPPTPEERANLIADLTGLVERADFINATFHGTTAFVGEKDGWADFIPGRECFAIIKFTMPCVEPAKKLPSEAV